MVITLSIVSSVLVCAAIWQFVLRRKVKRALAEAKQQTVVLEHKIRTILNNAPIVFSRIDTKGIFQISEGKGLEKLGRKDNQSVGVSIYEMHNQNPLIIDTVNKALGGEFAATSIVLNGTYYEVFMGPEKNADGVVTGASMLSVDITDRKKSEEERAQMLVREQAALETSKLKSEFLATMSHEIRTPINGVLGMATLLMDTSLTMQQREYAEAIRHSGAGLLTVINDILDFSKVEAGKLDFETLNFDFPDLIKRSTASLAIAARNKGVEFKLDLASSVPIWVNGDPGRVRQILNNLIGNAIKFTQQGHVTLRIVLAGNIAGTNQIAIQVAVEDSGIGMSKEVLDKTFVAFSQGEASMSRRYGGTGLGLSISKQLVEKMGGQIGVKSEHGKGSTFWFILPFSIGEAPVKIKNIESSSSCSTSASETPPRILVAEDNLVNQIIAVKMLQKMGCNADVAINGLEAITALEKSKYDLVLMDCQMPIMDGLEATRRIREGEANKNNVKIPIIAMTANAMKGDREGCIEAGMDDYIAKPVSFESLQSVVNNWLETQRKRDRAA